MYFVENLNFVMIILAFYGYFKVKAESLQEAEASIKQNAKPRNEGFVVSSKTSYISQANKLPFDWITAPSRPVQCGETYNIAIGGYRKFYLNSKQEACYLGFFGSRRKTCSVAFLCSGIMKFAEPSADGSCNNEYLIISDGTGGETKGCGWFSFDNKPRTPRNMGSDIYIYFKGQTLDNPCVAFCKEDLKDGAYWNIEKPNRLQKVDNFKGFSISESCVCGKRKDLGRIVGGETAIKYEFPWLAALTFTHPSLQRVPKCGAVLISDSHALTAAHCFDQPGRFQIVLHAHVMDKYYFDEPLTPSEAQEIPGWDLPKATDQSENSVRIAVDSVIIHPQFVDTSNLLTYDIAILKLKEKVNLAKGNVYPICLPYMSEILNFTSNDIMVAAGWGLPKEDAGAFSRLLQKIDLPYITQPFCDALTPATHTHFCAGHLNRAGKDTCQLDSGGPLIFLKNKSQNQYILTGLISAGVGCARINNPGINTDIQEVLQWIYHNTANGQAMLCKRD